MGQAWLSGLPGLFEWISEVWRHFGETGFRDGTGSREVMSKEQFEPDAVGDHC